MGKFLEGLFDELKLYVRYSAWLSAVPERAKDDKSDLPLVSRFEARRQRWVAEKRGRLPEDYDPEMPPLNGTEFLIGFLFEVGPVMPVGMGVGRITHSELRDWMDNTGVELDAWQARTLCELSQEYAAENHRASKQDCPPPWTSGEAPMRALTSTQAAIRALAALSK